MKIPASWPEPFEPHVGKVISEIKLGYDFSDGFPTMIKTISVMSGSEIEEGLEIDEDFDEKAFDEFAFDEFKQALIDETYEVRSRKKQRLTGFVLLIIFRCGSESSFVLFN